MPARMRSSWSRKRGSISPRTPDSAPSAPEATRAISSKNRFWLCIGLRLLGCFLLVLAGGVLIDRLLDRRTGAPDEIGAVADRVIVAAAQQVAALLEVRVDEAGHQFVMPFCLLPIGPVLRQLAQNTEASRA